MRIEHFDHCNLNHLFDETPWKNFYDELMIKPNDTLGDVNPHYQIIAIILPNGEEILHDKIKNFSFKSNIHLGYDTGNWFIIEKSKENVFEQMDLCRCG